MGGCLRDIAGEARTLNSNGASFYKYDHITVLAIYFYTRTPAVEREEGRDHNSHSPMTRPP